MKLMTVLNEYYRDGFEEYLKEGKKAIMTAKTAIEEDNDVCPVNDFTEHCG